mmetsp:Transcript_99575/g.290690  ORF Transcript_99575/g.290690 Transcript_99575/m.290690 type:complete len:198 (-) Transcript_99575:70-663(-)
MALGRSQGNTKRGAVRTIRAVLATGLAYCREVRGTSEALLARRFPPEVIEADQGGWHSADGRRAAWTAVPARHWCCRSLLRADKGDQMQRGDWTGILLVVWLQRSCRGFEKVPGNRGTLKILEDNEGSGSLCREVVYVVFSEPARVLPVGRVEARMALGSQSLRTELVAEQVPGVGRTPCVQRRKRSLPERRCGDGQ